METNNIKDLFGEQIEKTSPITEDTLEKLSIKNYYNGNSIKVGEQVLVAYLIEDVETEPEQISEIKLTIITLNESQFDLYEPYHKYGNSTPPSLKLKK